MIMDLREKLIILFCLLVIQSENTCAFFDSIKATIGEAKVYLNDILPMINGGLKAVKQFEEFVENTLDEECYFECPRGKVLRGPKPGHHKTSNGCGSMNVFFDDSEESWIHVEREFSECCNVHDECYDTCGEDKDLCDLTFRKCLYQVCRGSGQKGFLENKKCKLKAKLFYMAVVGAGCQPYRDAQSKACDCVKSEL